MFFCWSIRTIDATWNSRRPVFLRSSTARRRSDDDPIIFKQRLKVHRESHVVRHASECACTDFALFLSVPLDGSERTAVTFRFDRFLFFFSPSSLLPPMHPSSSEGTRGRIRARAGHDRRSNSDWHLLFFSPDFSSSSSSSPSVFSRSFRISEHPFDFAIVTQAYA